MFSKQHGGTATVIVRTHQLCQRERLLKLVNIVIVLNLQEAGIEGAERGDDAAFRAAWILNNATDHSLQKSTHEGQHRSKRNTAYVMYRS